MAFSPIFQDADPHLESAMVAIETYVDKNGVPDNSSELLIRAYLVKLAKFDDQIDESLDCAGTVAVGKIQMDKARAMLLIKQRQREYIGWLADVLSSTPYRDALSPAEVMPGGHYLAPVSPRGAWP